MSWLNLNQSLNSLKGQITNFASEVLSEGAVHDSGDTPSGSGDVVQELQEKCQKQEAEIKSLESTIGELHAELQGERQARKNGVREEDSSWYWDPVSNNQRHQPITDDQVANYQSQIKALEEELSHLKESRPPDEVIKLKEENRALVNNLEDLDSQHQQAMERLLALKKELQKNFELLKQEHEDLKNTNEDFTEEIRSFQSKLAEKDKIIEELAAEKSDYDTLYHKYQNLERIHGLLRENAEKFQEENQDLHEEVFKLQEQVTKLEHEIELSTKHTELSDSVPRERYDDLLKELNDIRDRRVSTAQLDEVNIDDNAKSVIESLKREISELKHKLVQKEAVETIDDAKVVKTDKIMQLYNKYINFELPVDYVGEIPTGDSIALYKLESAFKTLHLFKKDKDNLEHKLSDKILNLKHLQTQIDDLTTENDFLTTDVHHFESELNEMKKNNDFLLKEIAALKNTSKLEPIIETHEDNIVKLESELADCNKINRTFESEIKRVEKELSEVKSEKVLLQKSLEDLKEKYTQMLSDFETLKTKSEATEGMEHEIITVQDDKLRNKSDEVDELKKQLNESLTKSEKLAIDISIIENDKVLLTKEVDDLKHVIENLHKEKKDIESNRIAIEASVKDYYEKKLQDATSDLEKYKVLESQNDTKQEKELAKRIVILGKTNSELGDTIQRLTTDVNTLTKKEHALIDENKHLNYATKQLTEKCSEFEKTITELKSGLSEKDNLQEQAEILKDDYKRIKERNTQIEKDLQNAEAKLLQAQYEFEEHETELRAKALIIDSLNSTIAEHVTHINTLNQNLLEVQNKVTLKNQEIEMLKNNLEEVNDRLTKSVETENARKSLIEDKEMLYNQMHSLQEDLSLKNNEISKLRSQIEDITLSSNDLKANLDEKEKHIHELNVTLVELTEKAKVQDNNTQLEVELANLTDIESLKADLNKRNEEINELRAKIHQYKVNITEYNKTLEVMNKEKGDLINLVTLKHNESIQYHAEIQRLNQVLLEQTNQLKNIKEETNCSHCDNLKVTLKEKDEIIKMLNQNVTDTDRLKTECANATESVRVLTEKCDNLDKSLAIQLEAVKKLTAENLQLKEATEKLKQYYDQKLSHLTQLSELEANSTKELDRLRQHLLELEESYTQELMASEQKLQECQTRLRQVEERAKQTSTVYTSNSIRANQEVETLRNQIKLLERQREEVQSKLSEGEDARGRSEAALANLQMVLEQFQSDKERDIEATTVKLRGKMASLEKHNGDLKQEIARLSAKLEEALAGLQAATRLGDQLETKVAIINDLKEQVRTLQTSVAAAEERYYNAISNQQDKVDKELVKNLVVNYVQTQGQSGSNRTQVLRVLSTVLDFNQQECTRLGLTRGAAPDSLAQEFVKFLQKESKPRAPPPDIAGITAKDRESSESSASVSRKSSGLGPQPNPYDVGHKRNPSTGSNNLLFQNIDNLSTTSHVSIDSGVNQTRNTEGAILKHVLKDM